MIRRTRISLSNGLPVVVIEIPGSKSLITSFWTKAGSRFDPVDKAGLAHFVEHLLVKKTKKYPTDIKLAKVLEEVGAFKNGTTSKNWMNLSISSSSKDFKLVLKILAEMVFNPYMDEKGFEAERKVILQEKARKESLPDDLVWEILNKVYYQGSPLTSSVLGTEETLSNITLGFVKKYWKEISRRKDNMLFISGGARTAEIRKFAEIYFGKTKLGDTAQVPTFKYSVRKRIAIEKRDLARTNMIMSFTIPGGVVYKDIYSLLVLRGVLSLGWSSRLYQRLRVKESLVYGIGSRIVRHHDIGAFMFILASDKDNFPKMIKVLCEELVRIREKGITDEEMKLAKGFIAGTTLSSMETSRDYLEWYVGDELYWPGKMDSVEERVANIQKVTRKEVEKVAREYLTRDNWLMGVVGNVGEKDIKVRL